MIYLVQLFFCLRLDEGKDDWYLLARPPWPQLLNVLVWVSPLSRCVMKWAPFLLLLQNGYCTTTFRWAFWPIVMSSVLKRDTKPGIASMSWRWDPATVPIPTPKIFVAYGSELYRRKLHSSVIWPFSRHSLQSLSCTLFVDPNPWAGTQSFVTTGLLWLPIVDSPVPLTVATDTPQCDRSLLRNILSEICISPTCPSCWSSRLS